MQLITSAIILDGAAVSDKLTHIPTGSLSRVRSDLRICGAQPGLQPDTGCVGVIYRQLDH